MLFNSLRNGKETYYDEIIALKSYLNQDNVAPYPHTTLSSLNYNST